MILRDYPLLNEAFKTILDDQPYPPHLEVRINGGAPVPKGWASKFENAEIALRELGDRTLRQVGVTAKDLVDEGLHGDISLSETALEYFVLPVNDTHTRIMSHMQHKSEAKDAQDVLYAFFDGDLRNVFQTGNARYQEYLNQHKFNSRK